MAMPARTLTAALVLLAFGCGDPPVEDPAEEVPPDPDPGAAEVDPTTLDYAPELEIDFAEMQASPTGLHLRDDVEGGGDEAEFGRTVVVHYTGYHPDGEVFDSSREIGEPFTVALGTDPVIPGWEEGVQGMREGGRRTLVIPPHLGYGPQGAADVIPPNAVLVFQVELLEVR